MPRLITICIDYLCKHIEVYADQIEILPADLKSKLFSVLSKINNLKDTSILVKLMTNQLSVIELRFVDLDDEFLNAMDCPNLAYLNINSRKCNITSHGLTRVFLRVPYLKTLILESCGAMNDDVLQYISSHCPLLQWLDIIESVNVTDTGIGYLSNLRLRALNISNIKQNGDGIKEVVDGASSEHLTELRVSRCGLPARTLQHILERCPLLSIFLFDGCEAPEFPESLLRSRRLRQLTWTI